jgi:hypothetical protein
MSGTQRFTQEEIQSLPRWVRLGFAARCVRRARNLLNAPGDQLRVIDNAINLTEQASRNGHASDQLADAAAAAYTLALNTVDFAGRAPGAEASSVEDDALIAACTVAHAAAFAAEAATIAVAKMAAFLVSQSVDFAIQAHVIAHPDLAGDFIAAMRTDLERLQEAVEKEGWGNLMPVPAHFFGPL